jgi:hypothetical protein
MSALVDPVDQADATDPLGVTSMLPRPRFPVGS